MSYSNFPTPEASQASDLGDPMQRMCQEVVVAVGEQLRQVHVELHSDLLRQAALLQSVHSLLTSPLSTSAPSSVRDALSAREASSMGPSAREASMPPSAREGSVGRELSAATNICSITSRVVTEVRTSEFEGHGGGWGPAAHLRLQSEQSSLPPIQEKSKEMTPGSKEATPGAPPVSTSVFNLPPSRRHHSGGLKLKDQPTIGSRRWHAAQLLQNQWLAAFISVVILANTAMIGIEVEFAAQGNSSYDAVFVGVGLGFVVVYVAEIFLQFFAYRWGFFTRRDWMWNIFDLVLTVVYVADLGTQLAFANQTANPLTSIRGFRALRIVRLIHTVDVVRTGPIFRPLRLLVSAMLVATRSCLWLLIVLIVVVYTFSLVFAYGATEILRGTTSGAFQEGDVADLSDVTTYFGTLPRSFYTLFKAMSGGLDWSIPAEALEEVGTGYMAFFLFFMFFIFFIFLNVVTGVFCQIVSDAATKDHTEQVNSMKDQKREYERELRDLFQELDDFGSSSPNGSFMLAEVEEVLKEPRVQAAFQRLEMDIDDAWTLFRLFDTGDGFISFEEFVEACKKMKGTAKAADVQVVLYSLKKLDKKLVKGVAGMRELMHVALAEMKHIAQISGGPPRFPSVDALAPLAGPVHGPTHGPTSGPASRGHVSFIEGGWPKEGAKLAL